MAVCFTPLFIFPSRSKDIVEPLIKPQWYVDCQEMADMAVKVTLPCFVLFSVYCVVLCSKVLWLLLLLLRKNCRLFNMWCLPGM